MFLVLVLYAFFASTFVVGKFAVLHTPPILFIAIRMLISGILLYGFARGKDGITTTINKDHLLWFAPIVFFHIYLSFVLEYVSIQYLTAAKTCLLFSLSPFITALFSYIFFKEVMTPKKWAGLLIGFVGFLPVMLASAPVTENILGSIGPISIPEILMVISVIASCIGWIAMKKLTQEYHYSYFFVNAVGMFGAGVLAVPTSYLLEIWPAFSTLVDLQFVWPLAWLIIVGNFLCFNLYGHLLHRYSATILSFFGFLAPLFAAIMGWFFLGEAVSSSFFVTLILVTIGIYIFYQEELKQGYIVH